MSRLVREFREFEFAGTQERRFVLLWQMRKGERISEQVLAANAVYRAEMGRDAEYAFIRKLPRGVECGVLVGPVMMIDGTDWLDADVFALWSGNGS